MKRLKGDNYNIHNEILGRITFRKHIVGKSKYIYACKGFPNITAGYLATITESSLAQISSPIVCNVEEFSYLNEGDVVTINSDNGISVLYEKKSNHNSIMLTELCNHRCIMCPQPPISKENERTEFNLKLISLFDKKTKSIAITGGEPTLIGDKLFTVIRHIKKELPNTSISILSNGVKFADRDYAKKLELCSHFDLQVDIPLFSDIDSEHNRIVGAKTFFKTIEGLYNLALFNQNIGIRIVIHKQTYKRLPQLAEFIYRNFPFVCHVAFMQMETTGLAAKNIEELWIDPYDYNSELKDAVFKLARYGMNVSIFNAQLCVLPVELRQYAKQSISDWKDIFLDECNDCSSKLVCAGFFSSSKEIHSNHIKKTT